MILEKKFNKMIAKKGSLIAETEARELYWSMALSIALFIIGKNQSEKARAEEEQFQQALLTKIDFSKIDKQLQIYFEHLQSEEKRIRREAKAANYPTHKIESFVLESRIAIFSQILNFTLGDTEKIEQFENKLNAIRKTETVGTNKLWKVGIGVAGAAILSYSLYQLFKPKDEKK